MVGSPLFFLPGHQTPAEEGSNLKWKKACEEQVPFFNSRPPICKANKNNLDEVAFLANESIPYLNFDHQSGIRVTGNIFCLNMFVIGRLEMLLRVNFVISKISIISKTCISYMFHHFFFFSPVGRLVAP